MSLTYIFYYAILLILLVFSVGAGWFVWQRRYSRGALTVLAAQLICCLTIICYGALYVAETDAGAFFWTQARFLPIAFFSPIMLMFAINYIGSLKKFLPYAPLLLIMPIVTNIIVWTQPIGSPLFFASWERESRGLLMVEKIRFSGWFWVHSVYSSICGLLALALICKYLFRTVGNARWYIVSIVSIIVFSMVLMTFPVILAPVGIPNLTPFATALLTFCGFWGFYRQEAISTPSISYRTILRFMQDAVFVTDKNNRIVELNQAAASLVGVDGFAAVGKELASVLPELSTIDYTAIVEREYSFEITSKGAIYDVRVAPLRLRLTGTVKPYGFIFTLRDVTALRQAVVAAQAATLAKGQFLANVSHELRTPLNAILGFTGMIANESLTSARQREWLAIIERSGEHLLSLINEILEASKMESGKLTLHAREFNLPEMCDLLYQMFKDRAETRDLSFEVYLSERVPANVYADEAKIYQIALNLLSNAFKFTKAGYVKLEVDFKENNRLTLTVSDSGAGIGADEQKLLFQAFSQTQSGLAAKQGTGLGLYISREYARLMNGDIFVNSTIGLGSSFTLEVEVKPIYDRISHTISGHTASSSVLKPDSEGGATVRLNVPSNLLMLLRELPASSRQSFKQAVIEADIARARTITTSFQAYNPALSNELIELIDEYQLDIIADLAEKL
jgi:PAS domain S-box-containing protein